MPAVILPDNIVSVLQDLRSRLQKLEANQPSGLDLLTTLTCSTNDVYNYNAGWVTLPDATPPPFTLLRPQPILLVACLTYFGVGGTAAFILVSGGISATNVPGNNPNGNDVNGKEMYTTDGVLGFATTPAASNVGTYSGIRPFVCPAGTWYAHVNYKMFGGSLTTITNDGSSVDVFALSG